MARQDLRERARTLRKRGNSISVIAHALGVSKSTVSYWCRDISLTERQLKVLAAKELRGGAIGRLRAAEVKRAMRTAAIEEAAALGRKDVGELSTRDLYMLGLALYWGEGYKNANEECAITNSDPAIIQMFIRWMRAHYRVNTSDFVLRVSVNAIHRSRIHSIERYWSAVTAIPRTQFTKPSFIRAAARKVYENPHTHFGTLRIKVRRATALRRRILGSLAEVRRQFLRQGRGSRPR